MLRIWGRITSINVRKAVWTAQHLGLEFERIDAGGAFGIVKTPEYIALNPNSVVPTLIDGDFVLWESNVIVRYLCAKHSMGNLYPSDLQERFDAERWMDWQQTTFSPSGRNAFWELIRTPEAQRDMQKVEASIASTEPLLDRLEIHLSKNEFMACGRLTMADIPLACEVHRWFGLSVSKTKRPHLEAWYAKILARPASANVLTLPLS
jgi:glutathione S-transferase